jgi:hypothetical protein
MGMPPEPEDVRDRQLDALRRYVSDLDVRRRPHEGQARPAAPRRRGPWPWLLATVALMAVALAGGVAIGSRRDPAAGRAPGVAAATTTSPAAATPAASPECAEALRRADESLRHAVKVAGALREHTEVLNRLVNGELSLEAARRAATPPAVAGSAESARFEVALAAYRQVADRCQPVAP